MSSEVDSVSWWMRFKPAVAPLPWLERANAWLGALLGLLLTGWLSRWWAGSDSAVPLLVAPMGASSVLVFAVPRSPLAQPWSVIGGNVLAALIGVTVTRLIPDPLVAAAFAVATTIWVTSWLGCLHPPAGAVALTAVIGGSAITQAGYAFAFVPVALNSCLLVGAALLFNNLTRRGYPHAPPLATSAHGTADAPPEFRLGFAPKDIDAALARFGTPLEVEREDLLSLFRLVEENAHQRLYGRIVCSEIMSRDLVTARSDESARQAFERLRSHALRVLPIVDSDGKLLTVVDLATVAGAGDRSLQALPQVHFEIATEDTPIDRLLPRLSQGHVHEAMIVDSHARLVGVVTQTDLLAVLGRVRLAQSSAADLTALLQALSRVPASTGARQSAASPS